MLVARHGVFFDIGLNAYVAAKVLASTMMYSSNFSADSGRQNSDFRNHEYFH
jgi:hypothetical protein